MATPREKALWLAIATYFVVAFGGGWLFYRAVHDEGWRELFVSVWWLPSGFVAMWALPRLERFLGHV